MLTKRTWLIVLITSALLLDLESAHATQATSPADGRSPIRAIEQ
jgi:hypothetical protein